jgi:hypothetical protein
MELFNANTPAKQSFFIDLFGKLVKMRMEKLRKIALGDFS